MELLNFLSLPLLQNQFPFFGYDIDSSRADRIITGLGLSLAGLLLVTLISTLLIIFFVPIFLEFVRRVRSSHHRDIFSHSKEMKNI